MPEQVGIGKFCAECKRERYYAKGLCAACYMQARRVEAGLPQGVRQVTAEYTEEERKERTRAVRRGIEQRYAERHPEKVAAKRKRQTEKRGATPGYRELAKQRSKEWREANPVRKAEQSREDYWKNREHKLEQRRLWVLENRDKVRAFNTKREAMRHGATAHETVLRDRVYETSNGICHICKEPVSREEFELEHVIPLKLGGSHTYSNTAVAHPRCNRSKGAKLYTGTGQLRLL